MSWKYKATSEISDTCFYIRNLRKNNTEKLDVQCAYKLKSTSQSHYNQDLKPFQIYFSDTSVIKIDSISCTADRIDKCMSKLLTCNIKKNGKSVLILESQEYTTGALLEVKDMKIKKISLMGEKVYTR